MVIISERIARTTKKILSNVVSIYFSFRKITWMHPIFWNFIQSAVSKFINVISQTKIIDRVECVIYLLIYTHRKKNTHYFNTCANYYLKQSMGDDAMIDLAPTRSAQKKKNATQQNFTSYKKKKLAKILVVIEWVFCVNERF